MFRLSSVVLFGAGHAVEVTDETTLLQGVVPKKVLQMDDHPEGAIAGLMETAQNMLKHGATPDVVDFAQATLGEITGVVIPAIENASAVDQEWVHTTFAEFEVVLANLEAGTAIINRLNSEERGHSTAHKACRDMEEEKCTTKITCDYDLWGLWTHYLSEESELRTISSGITGHFCAPDTNGTLQIFREGSVPRMQSFNSQKEVVETATHAYGVKTPVCEQEFAQLDDQTAECDAHQIALEETACEHAEEVRRVREEFTVAWQNTITTYQGVVAEVRILVNDRIVEFQTLSTMQCLLDRTTERNGRPCDESTGETETEVSHCEAVRDSVDITWLELVYPEIPPIPPACLNRDSVEGRCMPEPPNYPCSAAFLEQEYSMLPAVPQPQFSSVNSHCNQRPECQRCVGMERPVTAAPVTEAPVTEAPVTEAPVTEAPVTEAPVTEAPVTEAPVTEAPVTEVPVTEAPVTEAPATEAPVTEAPVTEAPVTEAPVTEAPVTEN